MPAPLKQVTNLEEGQQLFSTDDIVPKPQPLSLSFFEEICDLLESITNYKKEEKDHEKKIEKVTQGIQIAKELLQKAEETKEILIKRNENLKDSLDKKRAKVHAALDYWRKYGLDIQKVPNEDNSEHYNFIHSKLNQENLKCTIGIKFTNRRLEIVSQEPRLLNDESLNSLSERLNLNCISDDRVDWKSVMVLTRKELIRNSAKPANDI